jgi:ATP-dependent helicase/nuclease subunit B
MGGVVILTGRAGQVLPEVVRGIGEQYAAHERVILLVPEQYTLQAERELVEQLDLPGYFDLDVLSPSRLRRRIRETGGSDPLPKLDDRGRNMALSHVLTKLEKNLHYYRRVANTSGLPAKVSDILTDLSHADVDAEALERLADETPSAATAAKLRDLALIWREYQNLIEGRFADDDAQEEESCRRLKNSGVVTDAHVWVYGFDNLPDPLCRLLCVAVPLARSVTVTMTMDFESAPDGHLFLTQRQSVGKLQAMLAKQEISSTIKPILAKEDRRAPALQWLEKYLFAYQSPEFEGDCTPVAIHACATPFAEASYAAQTLRRWHDAGIPWSKMAVALSSPASAALDVTLSKANIPHYMARKDSVLRHGLCRFLVSALSAVTEGYRQEDVLECARSGFSPLSTEEAMQLENYAIENGIRKSKWRKPFTRGADAEAMENVRLKLIPPLEKMQESLRGAENAAQSLTAIYTLLEDVGAYDRLMAREEELLRRQMSAEAAQNRQVWQLLLDVLDQLYAVLGTQKAHMKDLTRYIASALSGVALSSLPPTRDTVMVGEAGHLMTGALEALLVVGLQDGVLSSAPNSLLSEQERAQLGEKLERPVGISRALQGSLRLSDFYRTIAIPSRYLTLTFAEGAQDGAALRPSSLIADVQRLMPSLKVTGGVMETGDDAPLAPLPALEGLSLRLRAMADGRTDTLDETWQEALRTLWRMPDYHQVTSRMLDALDAKIEPKRLDTASAVKLFGQDSVSVSRLEEFAGCPYRHFVDYGLKPVERREFVYQADEKGSFFHEAMCQYAQLAAVMPGWPQVDDAVIDRMMDQVLEPLTAQWENGPLTDDGIGRQLGKGYLHTIRRAAKMFTEHSRNSRFVTIGTEVPFGQSDGLPPVVLSLKDGRKIALRGIIDRVDRFDGENGSYLRVVDYKSSRHSLEPSRVWNGLQLQLLMYLKAATDGTPGTIPGGAFYFVLKDPVVDTAADTKEDAEADIAKELRLKGVVLAENEVVEAMDYDQPAFSFEKVFRQDGEVAAGANALKPEEMQALLKHTEITAARIAQEIREGHIDVSPAEVKEESACRYCEYAAICRRDPKLPGGETRKIPEMNKQEFLERLANETASDVSQSQSTEETSFHDEGKSS